jgi:CspA family cold shock protein
MIGKVKWFDSKKGYGFILTEEGREVFVHYTGIVAEGFRALTEGQNVEFEIGSNEKGQQAMNVTVIKK